MRCPQAAAHTPDNPDEWSVFSAPREPAERITFVHGIVYTGRSCRTVNLT